MIILITLLGFFADYEALEIYQTCLGALALVTIIVIDLLITKVVHLAYIQILKSEKKSTAILKDRQIQLSSHKGRIRIDTPPPEKSLDAYSGRRRSLNVNTSQKINLQKSKTIYPKRALSEF